MITKQLLTSSIIQMLFMIGLINSYIGFLNKISFQWRAKQNQNNSIVQWKIFLFLIRVCIWYIYIIINMRKLDVENLLRVIIILIYRFIKYLSFAPIYSHKWNLINEFISSKKLFNIYYLLHIHMKHNQYLLWMKSFV